MPVAAAKSPPPPPPSLSNKSTGVMALPTGVRAPSLPLTAGRNAAPGGPFVEPFLERIQELTVLGSRVTFEGVITAAEQKKFELELRNFHRIPGGEVAAFLGSNPDSGLSTAEAASRAAQHGQNILKPPRQTPMWARFLLSFVSGFNPLLWFATLFVFLSWEPFGTAPGNVYNLMLAVVLLIVITISSCFTFYQELSTSRVLAGFKDMIPSSCIVLRDGHPTRQLAASLVVGDVVQLETGARVPADMRVLSAAALRVDKSMLTGESEPVRTTADPVGSKTVMLAAPNMVFMGCSIIEGAGLGIVIAIGDDNQIGKIASQVSSSAPMTSLQREINRFVLIIASFAFVFGVVVVIVWATYLRPNHPSFMNTATMIANAISIIVAFVPEGLPLAVTVGLTIIARRLCAKHFILLKQLGTVETLGSISMIASDKTGTLTQNKMTVVNVILDDTGTVLPPTSWAASRDAPAFRSALRTATLCNTASLQPPVSERTVTSVGSSGGGSGDEEQSNGERVVVGGNGIDKACFLWADDFNATQLRTQYTAELVMPFSSTTKMAAGVWRPAKLEGAPALVLVKGAPEYVLARCSSVYPSGGADAAAPVPLTEAARSAITAAVDEVSKLGQRVVALAELPLDTTSFPAGFVFSADPAPNFPLDGLVFIAAVAVSDPPRPNVAAAIAELRGAGIKIAMVTGDAAITATAIAREVGIISDADKPDSLKAAGLLQAPITAARAASSTSATDGGGCAARHHLTLAEVAAGTMAGATSAGPVKEEALPSSSTMVKYGGGGSLLAPLPPSSRSIVVTGPELYNLSRAAWDYIFAHDELVFARTTPEQKLQIVRECKDRGHRVGVTGDGVNDAPALKAADVGIAMSSGSEVARGAAAVVLLTDDFAAIPRGVAEGRLIFANLRRVVAYQTSAGSWSEALPVLACFFVGMPQPLSSFLMIVICCITDVAAGIALMYEKPEGNLMTDKPRDVQRVRLVTLPLMLYSYLFIGNMQSLSAFIVWFIYLNGRGPNTLASPLPSDDDVSSLLTYPQGYTPSQMINAWKFEASAVGQPLYNDEVAALNSASSTFFTVLVISQMGHLLSIRKKTPYFVEALKPGLTPPQRLGVFLRCFRPKLETVCAWLVSITTMCALNYGPALQSLVGSGSVPSEVWGLAIGFSIAVFTVAEVRKWIIYCYPSCLLARYGF